MPAVWMRQLLLFQELCNGSGQSFLFGTEQMDWWVSPTSYRTSPHVDLETLHGSSRDDLPWRSRLKLLKLVRPALKSIINCTWLGDEGHPLQSHRSETTYHVIPARESKNLKDSFDFAGSLLGDASGSWAMLFHGRPGSRDLRGPVCNPAVWGHPAPRLWNQVLELLPARSRHSHTQHDWGGVHCWGCHSSQCYSPRHFGPVSVCGWGERRLWPPEKPGRILFCLADFLFQACKQYCSPVKMMDSKHCRPSLGPI